MKASRFSLTLPSIAAVTILTMIVMFPGRAAAEHVIYSFAGRGDGDHLETGLVRGKQGTLYGVTLQGGHDRNGTVFELTPPAIPGGAWTKIVLYSFTGGSDGGYPVGNLIFDEDGNLYGTTSGGGQGFGTVFELSPPAVIGGAWTENVLHSFEGSQGDVKDGSDPLAGLVIGWEGSLYGTTLLGGAFKNGTVFRLTKSKTGTWSEGVIHSFDNNGMDGVSPVSALIHDKAGNLYGTTPEGGSSLTGSGTVFELSPPAVPGESWTETILYNFTGTDGNGADGDGGIPYAGLVSDSAGNLYGTTIWGGGTGNGTVFELSLASGGDWTESVLYSFTGGTDGEYPQGGLIFDSAGNLFGTAILAGETRKLCGGGCGTVFELSPPSTSGGAWNETTLHRFRTQPEGNNDGYHPYSNLVFGKYGALYGTTRSGGTANEGTVFSIQP